MTTAGRLELMSAKMAAYTASIPCYICRGGNHYEAERCRCCFAPMAIAHQSIAQKVQPKVIATMGTSGAGKTSYLGMLTDILSRQYQGMQLLARGAFSVSLQQESMAALARCEFPPRTKIDPEGWHWVHCQLLQSGRRKPMELILPDISGDALLKEVDHPAAEPVVRPLLKQAAGAMIMVDASEAAAGGNQADFTTLKLLSYLHELDPKPKTGWRARPLSIVFSKADVCESADHDPAAFAAEQLPNVWQMCRERFPLTSFFAVSLAAGCVSRVDRGAHRVTVPLRIEPRGIIEPFRRIVDSL